MYKHIKIPICLHENRKFNFHIIPWTILEEIQLKEKLKNDKENVNLIYYQFIENHCEISDHCTLNTLYKEEILLLAIQMQILSKSKYVHFSYKCDNENYIPEEIKTEDVVEVKAIKCPTYGNPQTNKYDLTKDVNITSSGIFKSNLMLEDIPMLIEFEKCSFIKDIKCDSILIEDDNELNNSAKKRLLNITKNIKNVVVDSKIIEDQKEILELLCGVSPKHYEMIYEQYEIITNHDVVIHKQVKCPICKHEYNLYMDNFDFFL